MNNQSQKTNLDEKKDDKERIKTEKEAVIAAAASWNLKDLTEKAKKAPADYLLKKMRLMKSRQKSMV